MQKEKATSETFNDGTCSIRIIDEDGNAAEEKEHLRFQERTIGVKRHYEAMTAKAKIDRLIRVPQRPWLTTEYLVVIEGEVYELEQVQKIGDTKPKTNDLSLRITRQRRVTSGKTGHQGTK